MRPSIHGGIVVFKRTQNSPFEFGYCIESRKYPTIIVEKEVIYDEDLIQVTEIFNYSFIPAKLDYDWVKCRRFITWDRSAGERWDKEDMLIFNENKTYLILDKNMEGISILDEQFKVAKISYRSDIYSAFQQI